MYVHKTGYSPGEQLATHSRRRYRLHPSKFPNHQGPSPDLSLWLIHYAPAEPRDRIPINVIPIDPRYRDIMNTRTYLHQQGQIVQKEFMLHDRQNWPSIAFPRGQARGPAGMYGANLPPARIPQTMAYPPQHPTAGPPAKRPRTQPPAQAAASTVAVLDVDDEEDTSRGDLFDHTTPREISMTRYKQNHEWMEEILSSPYAIHQIIPADLGLGLRGELGSLTAGIFDAPYDPDKEDKDTTRSTYCGRLDPEKAAEFRNRANESIAQSKKDIEKMKAKHAKRLAKFKKGSLISISEKALRTAVDNPSDTGPEYWRLEGKIDLEENEDGKVVARAPAKVADIVAQVEASVGRHAAAVKELVRIQDGGYEEAVAIPSPPPVAPVSHISPQDSHNGSNNGSNHSGVMVDMDMGNSAAGLLDQYHTGISSGATPGSSAFTPQPHLQHHSSSNTPSNHPVPSPRPAQQAQHQQSHDISMADAGEGSTDMTGTGDWVVVPSGGISPTTSAPLQQSTMATTSDHAYQAPVLTTTAPSANPSPIPTTTSSANTPGMPDFHTSPNDFADLGDLDTAGDALASYGDDSGELGDLGMDMDVGMDDSAFGEAFHGVEPREGEGDNGLGDL